MIDTSRLKRNWKSGALGAVLAVALGLLQIPPLGPWLEKLSYDLPFKVRPVTRPTEVVIIAMDEKSHEELGQPAEYAAWDRGVHARLVRRLTECRTKAVVFDVLFDKVSTNDAPLLAAIEAATNAGTLVIVGGTVEESMHTDKITGGATLAPFDELEQIAPWGFAERGGEGRILRQHYVGAEDHRGEWVPSLSWRAAELTVVAGIGSPTATRWVNYYGPNGTLPTRSYHEVLRPDLIPASTFSNKVCFVGAHPPKTPFSGATVSDVWRTPYTLWGDARMPGVDIVTTVYLNLRRQDWLRRMSVGVELLVIVVTGVLWGWGLTWLRPTAAAGLGIAGMAVVTAAACWLVAAQQLWFSWMIIVLEQIPVSIAWSVRAYLTQVATEKETLATQLVAAQTALKEAATSEAPTRIDPSTLAGQIKAAANAPAGLSAPLGAGRPVIPDHDLVRRVGKGAYGEVWLARNVIGTYHAVKIVKREDFQSDDPFEREFKGIQKFMPISRSHPGFVQILHAGRNHQFGYIYYIMEMADDEETGQEINPGTYTAKNLAREIKKRGHLPTAECLQLSLDLTAALEYLHQQHLIHRDIKPSNIIFVKGAPKFADIGLVTDIVPTGRETTFLGTFGYIPPEGPGTPSADVFSLGMVLFEASTGQSCQQFPEASSTIRERPDSAELLLLNEIILKACQKDRSERYRSALDLREDLLKLQTRLRALR